MILVSSLGPNPSFFLFWGTFIRLGVHWDQDLDQGLTIVYKNLPIIVGNVDTCVAVTADYNVCKKSVRMINFTFHLLSNQTVLIRSKNWCC